MEHKKILKHLWVKFFCPLLLVGIGVSSAYMSAIFIKDFILINFIVDAVVIAVPAVLAFLFFEWLWETVTHKLISGLLKIIPRNIDTISATVNTLLNHMALVALGAMLYDTWMNGNHWFTVGFSAFIIALKIRETIRPQTNTTNVQTNL